MQSEKKIKIIAIFSIIIATILALLYATQPPLDIHSFRQSQTALTAYWFTQEGIKLNYITPVAGYPWSIPFEFPIYQAIVAITSNLLNTSLDTTGRIISFIFLLASLYPIKSIILKLGLPKYNFYIFTAILFSMPVYVYWGRSFMIETTALFFALLSINFYIDFIKSEGSIRSLVLMSASLTVAMLQKATTGLPILMVLGLLFGVNAITTLIREEKKSKAIGGILYRGIFFLIPISIGYTWVKYTDYIKSFNPLGTQLTSKALNQWNWGTWDQRFSYELWHDVVWTRMLSDNLGGFLGLLILLALFSLKVNKKILAIASISIAMGLIPILLFSNLHIVHNYYQSANLIFLAFAISLAITEITRIKFGEKLAAILLVSILGLNAHAMTKEYFPSMKEKFSKSNKDLALGSILERELTNEQSFIAFGNDWSSTLAYTSKRKSFTAPGWFSKYADMVENPERHLPDSNMGAVVSCGYNQRIFSWSENKGWKIGLSHNCLISVPEINLINKIAGEVKCNFSIDNYKNALHSDVEYFDISGWVTILDADKTIAPEKVYVGLHDMNGNVTYFDTLKIPRPDVNGIFKIPTNIDPGFSRAITSKEINSKHQPILVVRLKDNSNYICN
jgi:hypothetical protein